LLASAAVFRTLKGAAEFGISSDGIGFDFSKIIDRKDWIVSQITGSRMRRYFETQGVDVIDGMAKFKSINEVDVDGRTISFDKALIATGSTPFVPPVEGLEDAGYITSNEAINLRELPDTVIMVGGSAAGLEFSTVYESFGSRVIVVEVADRLASKEDREVSEAIQNYMNSRGVTIYTGAKIKRAYRDDHSKVLVVETPEGEVEARGNEIFIATGRRPLIDDLNLDAIGIKTGKKGIEVNNYLQTSIDNIYAAGDVIPGPQLAQAAAYEGDLVGMNALRDEKIEVSFRVIPRITWSYPEIASVGVTEDEAEEKGMSYVAQKFPFAGLGRAFADGERLGFVKVVADVDSDEIIGMHIIGNHADEMIHEGVIAMQSRIKVPELAEAIHCELTMAEGVGNAFIDLKEAMDRVRRKAA